MNKFISKIIGATLAFAMMIGGAVGINGIKETKPAFALSGTLGDKVTPTNFSANKTVIMVNSDVDKYVKSITTGSSGWLSTKDGTEENAMEFTLGGTATAMSLKTPENKYVGFTGTKNVSLNDSNTAPFCLNASGVVCVGSTSNTLRHNDSSKGFRVYSNDYKAANLYYVSTGIAASINGDNSVNVGAQWSPTNITEDESGNAVSGGDLAYTFTATDGAVISSSNASTGSFTASAAGTVTVSATKTGYAISDKVVTVNSLAPYINLSLTSGENAYTGQTVNISAEYGNGVTGLTWTVTSGSVSSITSSDSAFSGTIGGETGTLTIRATDKSSSTFSEVSVSVTEVTLTLNKNTTYIATGEKETLVASHNADVYGSVIWASDNEKVTVDAGVVTVANDATVGSTATITATSSVDSTVSASCVVTVSLGATIDLTKNTGVTTATADLLVYEASNVFSIKAEKSGSSTSANNYYGGDSNSRKSTRFYKNSKMSIVPNENVVAIMAIFKATSSAYANTLQGSTFENAVATVSNDIVTVTFSDGTKPAIATIKDTCGFESVKFFYAEKTARQKVETSLTTNSTLAYHYVKNGDNYTYSNISMRFGGFISKTLWNELDTDEHLIAGIGVMITGYDENLRSTYSIKDHAAEAVSYDGDYNIKTQLVDCYVTLNEFGSLPEKEDNYYWNFKQPIDSYDDVLDDYTAAAYIKLTNGDLVFMQQVKYSVWSLAKDYLDNRNCNEETAGGSLYHLYNDLAME